MKRGQPPGQGMLNGLHPAILATCRLIHNEAIVVLYEENVFIEALIDESNPNAKFIKRQKLLLPPPTEDGATEERWPVFDGIDPYPRRRFTCSGMAKRW